MDIAKERKFKSKRIGELLTAAKIIKPEVLTEALQIAKRSATPLGRVLISIGELKERDLQVALDVQTLIKDDSISLEFGIKALDLAIRGHIPLEEAFYKLGWEPPQQEFFADFCELGKILLEAESIDGKRLAEIVKQSKENNLTLGRCLILSRAVSTPLLTSALTALVMIRDGTITRGQAVKALKLAARNQQIIEVSLSEAGIWHYPKGEIRIGELLTSAGQVTEGDKILAIETGLIENQLIGQVFLRSGKISEKILEESLMLQALVAQNTLSRTEAINILKQAHKEGIAVETLIKKHSSTEPLPDNLQETLQSSSASTENIEERSWLNKFWFKVKKKN